MARISFVRMFVMAVCLGLAARVHGDEAAPAQKPANGPKAATVPAEAKPAAQQPAANSLGQFIADLDSDGIVDFLIANAGGGAAGPTAPQALSNYWIGIDGTPIDDAMRAQLELQPTQGLLINQVVADSPAANAGLKQYDVMISYGETAIAQIADLAKLLDEKKETVLPLKLVRAGKKIIIEVTPQRRPASQTGDTCPAISKVPDDEFARRVWLDVIGAPANDEEIQMFLAEKKEKKRELLVNRLMRKSNHANRSCTVCHVADGDAQRIYYQSFLNNGTFRLHSNVLPNNSGWQDVSVLPGFVQNFQGAFRVDAGQPVPDDVTVSITRTGTGSFSYAVHKGKQAWQFNESDGYDKVPEEVRAYLAPFYGSLQNSLFFRTAAAVNTAKVNLNYTPYPLHALKGTFVWEIDAAGDAAPATNPKPEPSASESAFQRLDKQLESLGGQLGELRQAMQQLHQTLDAEKAKAPPQEKKP